MSTCAVMLIKDEGDIIDFTLRHLLTHVDEVLVADNLSTDDTLGILGGLAEAGFPIRIQKDEEVAYYQSNKTTALAQQALGLGHSWILPCDADEIWYVADNPQRRIGDFLDGHAPDVQVITAQIYNHIPTAADDETQLDPLKRIGWRKREPAPMPKVCCRSHPSLTIDAGNHRAKYASRSLISPGLALRHFSWRTPTQYLGKIKNGRAAYAATRLRDDVGVHWRMWEDAGDEEILAHFEEWFWSRHPAKDNSLIFDPAPTRS